MCHHHANRLRAIHTEDANLMYPCLKDGEIVGVLDVKYVPNIETLGIHIPSTSYGSFKEQTLILDVRHSVMISEHTNPQAPEEIAVLIITTLQERLLLRHPRFFRWP